MEFSFDTNSTIPLDSSPSASTPYSELNPAVQAYLDEHLLRSINLKHTMTMKAGTLRPRNLRRRMSVKGAIKKTRSINVDCKYFSGKLFRLHPRKSNPHKSPFLSY